MLWFCGLPERGHRRHDRRRHGGVEDDGVVRLSNAEYLTRPLRLSPAEALALIVALRALAESAGPRRAGTGRPRRWPRSRPRPGSGPPRRRRSTSSWTRGTREIREAVDVALREGRQLQLTYYVASRDETTDRVADPLRLRLLRGPAVPRGLVPPRRARPGSSGWTASPSATVLDTPAEPPVDVSLLDVARRLPARTRRTRWPSLDLEPSARWVADYYPTEATVELADGRLRVELRYADAQWLRRLVMRLGGAARVVEPSELAESVRRARGAGARRTTPKPAESAPSTPYGGSGSGCQRTMADEGTNHDEEANHEPRIPAARRSWHARADHHRSGRPVAVRRQEAARRWRVVPDVRCASSRPRPRA